MVNKAFSLVELIVGVSISMLLMLSIGIFVSSGMQNIFLQHKAMQNTLEINNFTKELLETISSFDGSYKLIDNNSLIFKRKTIYDNGGFAYIGVTEENGFFCDDTNSESTITKHIFIKNFIPFPDKNSLTYSLGSFKSFQKEHIIKGGNDIIAGRLLFGNEFTEGIKGTKAYLNSPTGLALDNEEKLYIADTLNNRILYLSGAELFTLLDESDGINEPTGLSFEDKALYIANSGNGEILKFSSPKMSNPKFDFPSQNNVSEFEISIFKEGKEYDTLNTSDFSFSFDTTDDDITIIDNKLQYSFRSIDGSGSIVSETKDFTGNEYLNINLEEAGNYLIHLSIGGIEKDFIFIEGDEKVYTKNDNILEIINPGFIYPTGKNGEHFDISSVGNLSFDKDNDLILSVPIKSLEITKDGDLINIILKYYRNYNCYNLGENENKVETVIGKISLK